MSLTIVWLGQRPELPQSLLKKWGNEIPEKGEVIVLYTPFMGEPIVSQRGTHDEMLTLSDEYRNFINQPS